MIKKFIIFILFSIFIFTGCQTIEKKNDTKEIIPENNIDNDEYYLNEKFIPPNFLFKKFKVSNDNQNMIIDIEYEYSPELYELLREHPTKLKFQIEYPQELIDEISLEATEIIDAKIKDNGLLTYSVKFEQKLQKDLSESTVEKLNNDELDFRFIIYNEEMFAVQMFEMVQFADDFKNGASENILIDD